MRRLLSIVTTVIILAGAGGCAVRAVGPYQTPAEVDRNGMRAQSLTQQAVELLQVEPDEAEQLLRQALTADLYHGPAHNNLGVLFLEQGRLYEAANEFEWARKLMPGHPDPRLNLGLTLERAGQLDRALETYETALEVSSSHMPTIQAMTRLEVRNRRTGASTRTRLETIALNGDSPQWRDWARQMLVNVRE